MCVCVKTLWSQAWNLQPSCFHNMISLISSSVTSIQRRQKTCKTCTSTGPRVPGPNRRWSRGRMVKGSSSRRWMGLGIPRGVGLKSGWGRRKAVWSGWVRCLLTGVCVCVHSCFQGHYPSFSNLSYKRFCTEAGGDRVAAWLSPTKLHAVD